MPSIDSRVAQGERKAMTVNEATPNAAPTRPPAPAEDTPLVQVVTTDAVPHAPPAEASVAEAPAPPPAAPRAAPATAPAPPATPASILTIDIGGTKVKALVTGHTEPRKAPSGRDFTPARLVDTIRALAHDWEYEAISIGLPGHVGPQGPRSEPGNL